MAASVSQFVAEDEINQTLESKDLARKDRHAWLQAIAPVQHDRVSLSDHAKLRSIERKIAMEAIQMVVDNAEFEPQYDDDYCALKGWLGTFAGITVVLNPTKDIVLTVWAESAYGIDIQKKTVTKDMVVAHRNALRVLENKTKWTSHTVAVVDQSGSMRKIDTEKQVMRSDMVLSLIHI